MVTPVQCATFLMHLIPTHTDGVAEGYVLNICSADD